MFPRYAPQTILGRQQPSQTTSTALALRREACCLASCLSLPPLSFTSYSESGPGRLRRQRVLVRRAVHGWHTRS
jgi:hypothetical protein